VAPTGPNSDYYGSLRELRNNHQFPNPKPEIPNPNFPIPYQPVNLSTQIKLKVLRPVRTAQLRDGFVFDLAHAFTGEVETLADIFEAEGMVYADAEEITDHFFLPLGKGFEAAFYFEA
jgi:hypothetical protein